MAHFLATLELTTSQRAYSSKKKILESYLGILVSSVRCDLCLTNSKYYMIMMNMKPPAILSLLNYFQSWKNCDIIGEQRKIKQPGHCHIQLL